MLPGRGIDAHDPEPTEVALLSASADKRVLERGVDRFFGGAMELALVGEVPLRAGEQPLSLGPSNRPTFDSRHKRLLTLVSDQWLVASGQ